MPDTQERVLIALSRLFLDTDISTYHGYISDTCASSKYSLDELSDMLYQDVAPICMPSLFSINGGLAKIDKNQLIKKIQQHKNKEQTDFTKLIKPQWGLIARIYIGKDWRKIKNLVREKRNPTTN